jgi:ubiquinone biosynthesis protein
MVAFKIPTIARPIRHLRRYRHILTVFSRHGFGFALSHLPAEPLWLRDLYPFPSQEPSSLPVHFKEALEELGPAFVKLGQMLSTRPDLLPPSYISELSKLQDKVHPVPWEEVWEVLNAEFKVPPEEVFAEIDKTPLASASLAQVHAGKLKSRQKVAIKVQRSNIRPTLKTDLEIIHDIARYAQQYTPLGRMYDLVEIAEDFAETLYSELNYKTEGRNADRFRQNFKDEPSIYIPWIYWEYTSERVLVMEYLEGIKINQIATLEAYGHDRVKIAGNAARMIIKEVLEDGYFHADPHPGNFVVMEDEVIGAMDFGIVGFLSHVDRANLVRLYGVAAQLDARGVTDALIHIGAAPTDVDRRALARDVERMLNRYNGLVLKDIKLDELIADVLPIAFEHRLHMPTNFWLLAKTLSMMEGIGLELAPNFDIFAFSSRYAARLLLRSNLPNGRLIQNLIRRGQAWGDLFEELPYTGRLLLDRLEKGEPLKLELSRNNLEFFDRLVTRLVLSFIITGMIIGLAWLIPAVTNTNWVVQAIVILSFLVALLMGAAILFSILRRNK